jgi:hypothetical protein
VAGVGGVGGGGTLPGSMAQWVERERVRASQEVKAKRTQETNSTTRELVIFGFIAKVVEGERD